MDLAERYPEIQLDEVLCQISLDDGKAFPQPGMMLIDTQVAIWMLIFEDMATLNVNTELLLGKPQFRFQTALRYTQALSEFGYSTIIDPTSGEPREITGDSSFLPGKLIAMGRIKQHDDIRSTLAITALASFFGSLYAHKKSLIGSSYWLTTLLIITAVALAHFIFGKYQEKKYLRIELARIRAQLLDSSPDKKELVFTYKKWLPWWAITCFIGFLIVVDSTGISELGPSLSVLFGSLMVFSAFAAIVTLRGKTIIHPNGIEVTTISGKRHIPFSGIDNIRTEGMNNDWLCIEHASRKTYFSEYYETPRLLISTIQQGTQAAFTESGALPDSPENNFFDFRQAIKKTRLSLSASRKKHRLKWSRWSNFMDYIELSILDRHAPSRKQFLDSALLLEKGEIVWAYVVWTQSELYRQGKDDTHTPLRVLIGYSADFDENPFRLAELADSLLAEYDTTELADPIDNFFESIDSAKFNQQQCLIPLPDQITSDSTVYYPEIQIPRKNLPLNQLRSNWLPVLIATDISSSCMMLPWQYWDKDMLLRWKIRPKTD